MFHFAIEKHISQEETKGKSNLTIGSYSHLTAVMTPQPWLRGKPWKRMALHADVALKLHWLYSNTKRGTVQLEEA